MDPLSGRFVMASGYDGIHSIGHVTCAVNPGRWAMLVTELERRGRIKAEPWHMTLCPSRSIAQETSFLVTGTGTE